MVSCWLALLEPAAPLDRHRARLDRGRCSRKPWAVEGVYRLSPAFPRLAHVVSSLVTSCCSTARSPSSMSLMVRTIRRPPAKAAKVGILPRRRAAGRTMLSTYDDSALRWWALLGVLQSALRSSTATTSGTVCCCLSWRALTCLQERRRGAAGPSKPPLGGPSGLAHRRRRHLVHGLATALCRRASPGFVQVLLVAGTLILRPVGYAPPDEARVSGWRGLRIGCSVLGLRYLLVFGVAFGVCCSVYPFGFDPGDAVQLRRSFFVLLNHFQRATRTRDVAML